VIEVNTSPFIDNCQDYTNYIIEHKNNVIAAFEQIRPKIEAILPSLIPALEKIISEHDKSKWLPDEYNAYADHFYRGTGTQKEFDRAWLLHIHRNPHHWQHWLLKEDNGNTKALDMPFIYIIEMICDWHSFSAKKPESTAFNWFKDNKYKMVLSEQTENDVTYFVQFLRDPLLKGDKK
jgi:hypothetical protein